MYTSFTKVKLPNGWLGNMAPYPVVYNNITYKTTETLFQCLRFADHPEVVDQLIQCKSPMAVKMIAKKHAHLQEKNNDIENMRLCLRLKLEQHPELRQLLVSTGSTIIVEDCSARARGTALTWGARWCNINNTWVGKNLLGMLWMEMRDLCNHDHC